MVRNIESFVAKGIEGLITATTPAIPYSREGLQSTLYQLPWLKTTFETGVLTGPHGERTIGMRKRTFRISEGTGECSMNGRRIFSKPGDKVIIPPHATYNVFPNGPMSFTLLMELLNLEKLPK